MLFPPYALYFSHNFHYKDKHIIFLMMFELQKKWQFHIVQINSLRKQYKCLRPYDMSLQCLVSKATQMGAFPKSLDWLASLERAAGFRYGPHCPLSRTASLEMLRDMGCVHGPIPDPTASVSCPGKEPKGLDQLTDEIQCQACALNGV